MTDSELLLAKRIGERVRELRGVSDPPMTQENLAERAELSPVYISEVEHGKRNMSIAACTRIVSALGLRLSQFFAGIEE